VELRTDERTLDLAMLRDEVELLDQLALVLAWTSSRETDEWLTTAARA
jgi:hypothetical protein